MLGRVLAIAGNTYRENIRDKILYNLILFALIMILSSLALGQLTLGNEDKVITRPGTWLPFPSSGCSSPYSSGSAWFTRNWKSERSMRCSQSPCTDTNGFSANTWDLLFTLLVNLAVMTVGLALAMLYTGGIQAGGYLRLLPAVYLIFLSLALITALALLFSTFSSPALSADIHILSLGHRTFWQRPAELRRTHAIRIHKRAVPGPVLCNSQLVEFYNPGQPQHHPGSRLFPADRSLRHCMGYGILRGVLRIPRCDGHRDLHAPGF